MKITRFKFIRHRIFREFRWDGRGLEDFARYNLIYGWNFSGKTTLANLFQHVEERVNLTESNATFTCERIGDIDLTSLTTKAALPQVRVFNRHFIEKHVAFTSEGLTSPIFIVIGESAPEKQQQLESKREDIESTDEEIVRLEKQEKKERSALDDYGTDQARSIRQLLGQPGNEYYNYERPKFIRACDTLTNATILDKDTYDDCIIKKDTRPKEDLPSVVIAAPDIASLHENVRKILLRSITSKPIEALASDNVLSDWTRTGVRIHNERKSDICLFCTNRISEQRLEQLRNHFDISFNELIEDIDTLKHSIEAKIKSLKEISLPDTARLYDQLATKYDQFKLALKAAIQSVTDAMGGFIDELEAKRRSPFSSLKISMPLIKFDASKLQALNSVINEHNKYSANHRKEVKIALNKLHQHFIAERKKRYSELKRQADETASKVVEAKSKKTTIMKEVRILEGELRSDRPPVDELNRDLRNYLGHPELQLEYEETGYRLKRNGQPASDLSAGERTAFAFLYFLRRLSDTSFELKNGIVVVDDPVSSLDANSLFYAFGFMKERTQGAGQLFIMTHSFPFFSLVRNWFNHVKPKAEFYQINRGSEAGLCITNLDPLDKLLRENESEYHYLFKTIKLRAKQPAEQSDLTADYSYPNIARRLLESFLAFRYPTEGMNFHKKMERNSNFDASKRTRIERYLQTGSHQEGIPEPVFDPTILSETSEILKDLLEFIKVADEGHYDEMIRLCS